jgi:hypothetical protein
MLCAVSRPVQSRLARFFPEIRRPLLNQRREKFLEEAQQEDESGHAHWAMRIQPIFLEVRQWVLCNMWDQGTWTEFGALFRVRETISNQRRQHQLRQKSYRRASTQIEPLTSTFYLEYLCTCRS